MNGSTADTITLMCVASGFPIPSITWFHNETQVSSVTMVCWVAEYIHGTALLCI